MGNVSDILIAGLGGAASGYFKEQIKENDEAKVQAETERKEKLLLEKEKRQNEAEEYKALRDRGWKVDDMKTKRGEELADQDTKMVNDAAAKASERQFTAGQTDKNIASREKIAGMMMEGRENVAEISAEAKAMNGGKGKMTEAQIAKLEEKLAIIEDEGIDDSNINKVNALRKALQMPPLKKVVRKKAKEGILGIGKSDEEADYVESDDSFDIDPFDAITNNVKFKKTGANQNETVIQPQPLKVRQ